MDYNFDQIIDRKSTHCEKWDVKEGELPMWVADMDFKTAPAIIEALEKRTAHGIFGYSYVPDYWYDAYINWWKNRYDFSIEKHWLIFTTGVIPAISSMVRKLTTPAEKVLLQTPVYNIFFNSIVNNGRVPVECPLIVNEDGPTYVMDFEALEKDLSDPQVTLMILCNPQNPGGIAWDKESLSKVADLCFKYGVTVISDEIHCDITDPGVRYTPFASVSEVAKDISVTCLSPSKSFNVAGLHSAAVFSANDKLRHKVWRSLNTDEVAEPGVYAVEGTVAAYTEGGQWLDSLREYIYQNKIYAVDYIKKEIPILKTYKENATYLLWIDCSGLPDEGKDFARYLRAKTGLFISTGKIYGKNGASFVRMNLACPRSIVEEGLRRLKQGVEHLINERENIS